MKNHFADRLETPLGLFVLVVDDQGRLVRIDFDDRGPAARLPGVLWDSVRCEHVTRALRGYFAGEQRQFELELAPVGTAFQRRVWAELVRIPYGETLSYGELARRLEAPRAVRAVGRANATNPIPIVVPCHRVIGADGSLTGYAGGLERKRALLELEARFSGRPRQALISA